MILAVSHEDPITSIRNILLSENNNSFIETEVAVGIDSGARPANTKLGLVRFWRGRASNGEQVVKACLESWGGV